MDTSLLPSSRAEYEQHLFGPLCWSCHGLTHLSHQRQRYCPQCHRKWNYRHRQMRWELVRAFALGAPAHQATRTLGCSYSNAHAVYEACRTLVKNQRQLKRDAAFARNGIKAYGPAKGSADKNRKPRVLLGIVECLKDIFVVDAAGGTEQSMIEWIRCHKLIGCCLAAERYRSMGDLVAIRPPPEKGKKRRYHIDRLESFIGYCRRQWQHAPGVTAGNLPGYLAESEYRFCDHGSSLLDLLYEKLILATG